VIVFVIGEFNVRKKSPSTFLIVGLGSIGRRHASIVRRILPEARLFALARAGRERSMPADADMTVLHDIDAVLGENIDAAIIANPAPLHIETARVLAESGVDLLIEKPLSDKADGGAELIDTCRANDLVLQVGYCLRFDPALASLKGAVAAGRIGRVMSLACECGQYLPDWREGADYRETVSARKELGGGVLLELSHEIDYARWICGDIAALSASVNRLSDLDIDVEDHADLLVEFQGGCVGNIHIDMAQRSVSRSCRVIGSEGTAEWDGIGKSARIFDGESGQWRPLWQPPAADPADPADGIYAAQFKDFLRCIETGAAPLVGGDDGLRAVETVLAARRSAEEGRKVPV